MLSGYPLFRRIEPMFSSSCCSLLFEQIINARWSSVSIKLVLRFVGPNQSQPKYCPVKVGFLKTEDKNPSLLFSIKTSKNGSWSFNGYLQALVSLAPSVSTVILAPLVITSTSCVYCASAIGQYLRENEECAKHFNDAQFSILATARPSFHLSVLEATYIYFLQPILCRQKKFVYSLQISH